MYGPRSPFLLAFPGWCHQPRSFIYYPRSLMTPQLCSQSLVPLKSFRLGPPHLLESNMPQQNSQLPTHTCSSWVLPENNWHHLPTGAASDCRCFDPGLPTPAPCPSPWPRLPSSVTCLVACLLICCPHHSQDHLSGTQVCLFMSHPFKEGKQSFDVSPFITTKVKTLTWHPVLSEGSSSSFWEHFLSPSFQEYFQYFLFLSSMTWLSGCGARSLLFRAHILQCTEMAGLWCDIYPRIQMHGNVHFPSPYQSRSPVSLCPVSKWEGQCGSFLELLHLSPSQPSALARWNVSSSPSHPRATPGNSGHPHLAHCHSWTWVSWPRQVSWCPSCPQE